VALIDSKEIAYTNYRGNLEQRGRPIGRELRGIRGEEAIRVFVRAGGIRRGGKGDHVNIKMPNGRILTIPGNRELKIGLLKDAIKKAGLTDERFMELV